MTSYLITGGARSGKSTFAETKAQALAVPTAFIATATAFDAEMSQRIANHRSIRPPAWTTVEEPLHIAQSLKSLSDFGTVILDCLTVWLGNTMHHQWEDEQISEEIGNFVEELRLRPMNTLIVTNDAGLGIVPADAMTRHYRDLLGKINSQVAAACDHTLFFSAGRAVELLRSEHFL